MSTYIYLCVYVNVSVFVVEGACARLWRYGLGPLQLDRWVGGFLQKFEPGPITSCVCDYFMEGYAVCVCVCSKTYLSMCIHIYICTFAYVYIYIYTYT